jgi:hypothetical protein
VGSKPGGGTAGEEGTDARGLSELPLAFVTAERPATIGDMILGIPTSGPVVDFREKKLNIPFFSVGVGVDSSSTALGAQPIIWLSRSFCALTARSHAAESLERRERGLFNIIGTDFVTRKDRR